MANAVNEDEKMDEGPIFDVDGEDVETFSSVLSPPVPSESLPWRISDDEPFDDDQIRQWGEKERQGVQIFSGKERYLEFHHQTHERDKVRWVNEDLTWRRFQETSPHITDLFEFLEEKARECRTCCDDPEPSPKSSAELLEDMRTQLRSRAFGGEEEGETLVYTRKWMKDPLNQLSYYLSGRSKFANNPNAIPLVLDSLSRVLQKTADRIMIMKQDASAEDGHSSTTGLTRYLYAPGTIYVAVLLSPRGSEGEEELKEFPAEDASSLENLEEEEEEGETEGRADVATLEGVEAVGDEVNPLVKEGEETELIENASVNPSVYVGVASTGLLNRWFKDSRSHTRKSDQRVDKWLHSLPPSNSSLFVVDSVKGPTRLGEGWWEGELKKKFGALQVRCLNVQATKPKLLLSFGHSQAPETRALVKAHGEKLDAVVERLHAGLKSVFETVKEKIQED